MRATRWSRTSASRRGSSPGAAGFFTSATSASRCRRTCFWSASGPGGPEGASWLSEAERSDLSERLSGEGAYRRRHHSGRMLQALQDWRVWLLIVAYFTVAIGTNTSAFSFAKMIKYRFYEFSETQKGILVALPS